MKQEQCTKKRKKAKHFTYKERVSMESYIREHWPRGKKIVWVRLAELMGKNWRSVKNEYFRGLVVNKTSELVEYQTYSAETAEQRTAEINSQKGPQMKFSTKHAKFIETVIVEDKFSPYVAVERMKLSGEFEWVPCVKTIYNAIDNGLLEVIRANLPYGKSKIKQKKQGKRMAYRTPKQRSIENRPVEALDRKEYGHWEMDTIVAPVSCSSSDCLLVLTERVTRQVFIRKIPNKLQGSVVRALNSLERNTDIFKYMKSVTSDNGSEFWDFEAIERSVLNTNTKRCSLFYAHPFSSYERGSNENSNRIIRRFIPKGTDIGKFTHKEIKEIQDKINNMQRQILNGFTAIQLKEKIINEIAA